MQYFRHKADLRIPYETQGLIYFLCQNYRILPESEQKKIRDICDKVSKNNGWYFNAIYEAMTTTNGILRIALRHYVSEGVVRRLKLRFYKEYAKDIEIRLKS